MVETIYTSQTPASTSNDAHSPRAFGQDFQAAVAGSISAIRLYVPGPTRPTTVDVALFDPSVSTVVAMATGTGSPGANGWFSVALTSAQAISASHTYTAVAWISLGAGSAQPDYGFTGGLFASNLVNGNLTGLAHLSRFENDIPGGLIYPTNTTDFGFFVDVEFTAAAPGSVTPDGISVPVTLGSPTVSETFSVTPTGITAPVTLGAPTVSMTVSPDGITVPLTLGSPAVSGAPAPLGTDLVQPIAEALLNCLCTTAASAEGAPQHCCYRVGTEPAFDADLFGDLCCEGLAYVQMGEIRPSRIAPEEDVDRQAAGCGILSWIVNFRVGIVRCVPTGGPNGEMPSCIDWNVAAAQNFVDAHVLRVVSCCFINAVTELNHMLGMSVVISRQTQGGVQGGCIERYFTVDVQFPNCDC